MNRYLVDGISSIRICDRRRTASQLRMYKRHRYTRNRLVSAVRYGTLDSSWLGSNIDGNKETNK
jgi:hypothetical protein